MRLTKSALAAALSVLALSPATAAVVADPDAFAAGTDISNAFAGVSLLTVRTGANINDVQSTGGVFSVADAGATTGTRVFGQTAGDATWGNGAFEYLLATFTSTVSSVSLDFFANDSTDSNARLIAFDAMGSELFSSSAALVTQGSPVTLTVNGSGIKFIRAYWDETNRVENGGLDNLVFGDAAVPEPATWAMMIAGFGLMGASMRRARRQFATA